MLLFTSRPAGAVVLAHGFTADMDEAGMFGRLGAALAEAGLTALRFSFRGHGWRPGASPPTASPRCSFHPVTGSDHGFDDREHEDEAIAVTVTWLTTLVRPGHHD